LSYFYKFAGTNQLNYQEMKKLTVLVFIAFTLLFAIPITAQDKTTVSTTGSKDLVITPEKFQEMAVNNVGKEVEIQGLVVHVCKHGGKKLFIVGEDPEKRVKITTSDKVSVFEPELEGSTIWVKGIIEPLTEEELPEAEKTSQDADHTNYYHVPQFSISCMAFKTIQE
jgi:hypothetical protein